MFDGGPASILTLSSDLGGGMPKQLPKQQKTYTKRIPEIVRPLTEDQVRRVITEAFPCRPIDGPEFVECLRDNINDALTRMVPALNKDRMSDIEDIRKVFIALGKKLTDANIRLLAEIGGAHYRDVDRLSPSSRTRPIVAASLNQLLISYQEVRNWLSDPKAVSVIEERQKPLADLQIVAGHFLPDVFQMSFLEKFGGGTEGPGPRFVAAVLREAEARLDDGETTLQSVKKARKRMLKPKPLKARKEPPRE